MATLATAPLIKNIKAIAPEHMLGDLIQRDHPLLASTELPATHNCLVFTGTRVPVKNLFDYLKGGDPGVTREQAVAVSEFAQAGLLAGLPQRWNWTSWGTGGRRYLACKRMTVAEWAGKE